MSFRNGLFGIEQLPNVSDGSRRAFFLSYNPARLATQIAADLNFLVLISSFKDLVKHSMQYFKQARK